jgi:hypothetical protein
MAKVRGPKLTIKSEEKLQPVPRSAWISRHGDGEQIPLTLKPNPSHIPVPKSQWHSNSGTKQLKPAERNANPNTSEQLTPAKRQTYPDRVSFLRDPETGKWASSSNLDVEGTVNRSVSNERKEFETFNTALVDALARVQIAKSAKTAGEPDSESPMYVLNVCAPRPQYSNGERVSESFIRRQINAALESNPAILGNLILKGLGKSDPTVLSTEIENEMADKLKASGLAKGISSCACSNNNNKKNDGNPCESHLSDCNPFGLSHPDWYLGFFSNRKEKALERGASYAIVFFSQESTETNNICFRFNKTRDGDRAVISSPKIGPKDSSIRTDFTEVVSVSARPAKPPGGVIHEVPGGSGSGNIWFLIVYNAAEWRCRLSREGMFIDTNQFDKVGIRAVMPSNLRVKAFELVLNGVRIMFSKHSIMRKLSNKSYRLYTTKTSRLRMTVYKGKLTRVSPSYNARDVYKNPLVNTVSSDIGQSWSMKYGCPWKTKGLTPQHNIIWDAEPKEWCSEVINWAVNLEYNIPNFPKGETSTPGMAEWFTANDRYIAPGLTTTYRYEELGDLVKPGYFISMKNGKHAGMFLYWITPPETRLWGSGLDITHWELYEWDCKKIADLLDDGSDHFEDRKNLDPRPTYFRPNVPINWCRVIEGNHGDVVQISVRPVINLSEPKFIEDPKNYLMESTSYVIWWRAPDQTYTHRDGFGNTRP